MKYADDVNDLEKFKELEKRVEQVTICEICLYSFRLMQNTIQYIKHENTSRSMLI